MSALLQRIVVKNVGVLKAFNTPRSPLLDQLTSFYARNGRGKTTLAAILRSAGTNDPAEILGRRTLGQGGANPEIILLFDTESVRFDSGRWQSPINRIEVFDGNFISDNLYAGEGVDLSHDRSLFKVVLGRSGVKLARHLEFFAAAAKRTGQVLKDAEAALSDDLPSDLSREEFLALVEDTELEEKIEQAEKNLKGVLQADRLTKLRNLQPLAIPEIPSNVSQTIGRTIRHVDASARDHLAEHFKKFQLGKQGEAWVRFGLEHIRDDSCPFCGKIDVQETGLVTLYTQIFGDAYKRHFEDIQDLSEQIDKLLGPDARSALSATATANVETLASWSEFYALGRAQLPALTEALDEVAAAYRELRALLDAKRQSPLVAIHDDEALERAAVSMGRATTALAGYNGIVLELEKLVENRKLGTALTEAQARVQLSNLLKRKRRNDPGVQSRILAALKAKRRDSRSKHIRGLVQDRLKEANKSAAEHYHVSVNNYLKQFGTKFFISQITNAMTGNVGSVEYGLIVRGHTVKRGRGREKRDEPTFMNTLSTGDKTTLAFAFFLANLDRLSPVDFAKRIVVFDDPLSSHDSHRRGKTVDILSELSRRCSQVIVLSHDAHFLRRLHRRCNHIPKVAYEIEFDGPEDWSVAKTADLNELCESEHARQVRKIHTYYELRHGDPSDIGAAIRTVLETYFRAAYRAYFPADVDLGEIVRRIRARGPSHPCWAACSDLDSCNVNTLDRHHGDDPNVRPREPMDPDELHALAGTCLLLVHDIELESIGSLEVAAEGLQ